MYEFVPAKVCILQRKIFWKSQKNTERETKSFPQTSRIYKAATCEVKGVNHIFHLTQDETPFYTQW